MNGDKKRKQHIEVTREWQRRRVDAGLCQRCGRKRRNYAAYCDDCALKERLRNRLRQGNNRWKPGGRGRPPLARKTA
jgi:predicted amidophosphoribosyltransferase